MCVRPARSLPPPVSLSSGGGGGCTLKKPSSPSCGVWRGTPGLTEIDLGSAAIGSQWVQPLRHDDPIVRRVGRRWELLPPLLELATPLLMYSSTVHGFPLSRFFEQLRRVNGCGGTPNPRPPRALPAAAARAAPREPWADEAPLWLGGWRGAGRWPGLARRHTRVCSCWCKPRAARRAEASATGRWCPPRAARWSTAAARAALSSRSADAAAAAAGGGGSPRGRAGSREWGRSLSAATGAWRRGMPPSTAGPGSTRCSGEHAGPRARPSSGESSSFLAAGF
jgi:hypothetical protein